MALLKQVLPFDDYDFFICGPTPFMRSLYCGLLSLGMPEDRIHYEFFGPGSMLAEESKPAGGLIPTGINQNPWAHFRRPIDMIFQG